MRKENLRENGGSELNPLQFTRNKGNCVPSSENKFKQYTKNKTRSYIHQHFNDFRAILKVFSEESHTIHQSVRL